ncbi:MAG TPA: preprotein translocase subunit YajC [Candidatus Binatia bacterium]|jgi:preprotein translocase subunit YajC
MISPAWAQAAHGSPASPLIQFAPLVLIFVVFYFLLIRPQQQKAKEQRTMIANLKRNDEVVTTGGLYGKVVALTDKVLTLEIAPNVRVRVERAQVVSLAKAGGPEDAKEKEKQK